MTKRGQILCDAESREAQEALHRGVELDATS